MTVRHTVFFITRIKPAYLKKKSYRGEGAKRPINKILFYVILKCYFCNISNKIHRKVGWFSMKKCRNGPVSPPPPPPIAGLTWSLSTVKEKIINSLENTQRSRKNPQNWALCYPVGAQKPADPSCHHLLSLAKVEEDQENFHSFIILMPQQIFFLS